MKFTAPDGKEFESKVELRKYVMDKFYSFKNKENDDQLIKRPGEINQQVFEISDCKHCTIVILDITDQTYIDNLSNCRVFIGACSSSIFVRDCKQCVFFTCSRQLRINNVVSSSFYSFTLSEIHMELSSALQFGPFQGGYDMQSQHFEQNGFDVNDNLWFEVYDHNDPDKLQANWKIIEPKSYEPAWFPLGPCRAFIKLIEPKKIGIESKIQVGESFGLDQMIADSKKISKEKSLITTTTGPKKIPIESALLVVTAENNDIDLDVWFKVEALQGRVKAREFNDLLCSLSATMSINQSPSTKSELDAAVSKGALKCIEHVCGIAELDEDGSRLIDVVSFFQRSRVIVDEYMQGFNEELSVQEADDEGIAGDSIAAVTNENDLDEFDHVLQSSQYDCFTNDIDRYRDSALVDFQAYDDTESVDDALEYLRDIREIANRTRPQSAPAGHGGQHLVGLTAITTTSGLDEKASLKLPSSPYDEEIAFEYDDDEEEEGDFTYIKSRQVPPSLEQFWEEENHRYLMQSASFTDVHIPLTNQTRNGSLLNASIKNNNLRPRPSSAGPRIRGSAVGATTAIGARRGRQTQSMSGGLYNPIVRASSSDSRVKLRNSFSGPITRHDPTKIKTKTKIPSSDKLNEMKDMVEDLIRSTVKKADLYHMIQVYLGYIDSYTMVPPRGSIIKSRQREWFTSRDLQTAFMAARLYLSEPQLFILRSLVHAFSQQHQQQHGHVLSAETDGARLETDLDKLHRVPVIGSAHSLNAQWLKRYLIHLRLTKKLKSAAPPPPSANPMVADPLIPTKGSVPTDQDRSPVPWKVWLGRKLKKEVRSGLTKPKEFERALSGLNHPLGKEDIELMLRTYSVLPPEVLQQEVECRIESWLLDMDGRRDFQHELNVNLRRWIWTKVRDEKIKLPTAEKGYWHVWQSLPEDQKKVVKADILNMIIQQKREELLSKERTKQVITRELYWKFDEKRGSSSTYNWMTFLSNHIKSFKKALEDFRVNENDRLKRLASVKSKKKTVAGLSEVESKLKKMQPNMDSYHQIELQKAINALRRTALINNVAKGTVITKEAFDEHLKDLLAPYLIIKKQKQKQKASSSRTSSSAASSSSPSSREGKDSNDLSGIFHSELKKAVDRVVELESERSRNSKARYLEWLNEKDFQRSQELKRLQETQQREKEKQAIKEKQNRKEFRKWNRLHRNNKYRSMVDQKPRPLPPAKTIQHSVKWNNEVDMAKLYFEREQKC